MGWKTAAKTWSSNTWSVSVRAWIFTSLQPLLVDGHLFPQIKAQEKMKWRTSARGLTISLCQEAHHLQVFFLFLLAVSCAQRARKLPCADSCFPLPSGRVHNTRGNGAICQERKGLFAGSVLWRKREGRRECRKTILYNWQEKERSWVRLFLRAEIGCSFQDPTAACLESVHERRRQRQEGSLDLNFHRGFKGQHF